MRNEEYDDGYDSKESFEVSKAEVVREAPLRAEYERQEACLFTTHYLKEA